MEAVRSSFWWVVHWVSYRTNRAEHEGHCICKGSGVLPRRPWQARTGRRILCQQIYQAAGWPGRCVRLAGSPAALTRHAAGSSATGAAASSAGCCLTPG